MDNGASSYRRYLNGDEDAFAEIVEAYFDNLVFFIHRYVQDYEAAEDIALDAFTYLVVHKHRYHFRVSLKTYLFTIGRSRALDYIRRRGKIQFVALSDAEHIAADGISLEENLLQDEQKKAINAAIMQLDHNLRLVIHLVYFEELTIQETAAVMKKSKKQIYNFLYRAKNALRAILGEEGKLL